MPLLQFCIDTIADFSYYHSPKIKADEWVPDYRSWGGDWFSGERWMLSPSSSPPGGGHFFNTLLYLYLSLSLTVLVHPYGTLLYKMDSFLALSEFVIYSNLAQLDLCVSWLKREDFSIISRVKGIPLSLVGEPFPL